MSRFTKPQLLAILRAANVHPDKRPSRDSLALNARVHDLITEEDYRDTAVTSPLRNWNVPGPRERSVTAAEILRGANKMVSR